MTGLIGTLIEHPITVTDLTDATEKQEILGFTISLTTVTAVRLKLLPAFLTDKMIGFLSHILGFSFHELAFTTKVVKVTYFYCGTRITEYMP